MMNKITLLGSGTSTGIPILGCKCQVCQSKDIRNKRLRTSALIHTKSGKNIIVDTTPDLRSQLIQNSIDQLNAVIITHDHADHTHGMDDLRPFGFINGEPIPVYTNIQTAESLKNKFPYIFKREDYFKNKEILGGGIPLLNLCQIDVGKKTIMNEIFYFLSLPHGHDSSIGIIHGRMAYLVDCREIPPRELKILKESQLELLIIDCLRPNPHQTHLHFAKTVEYIKEISPKLAVLTHLGHEWDHLELMNKLMEHGVENTIPGQDGLSFLYSSS